MKTALASSSAVESERLDDRANILIVDDQEGNLLALQGVLEGQDRRIHLARSGREALRLLLEDVFAVIIMDVRMPELDGFETAELIRERESTAGVPIIFLTAAGKTEEQVFHGYSLGAVDYLFKPVVPEILRSKVAVFVDMCRKREQLRTQSEALERANKALSREVVERRRAEGRVEELNRHLARRATDLEAVNAELESFAYSVSHDLRAPLRAIDGFSRSLEEKCGDALDADGRDYLSRVRAAAQRMDALIEDLLLLSRITRTEIRSGQVDLSSLADEVVSELRANDPEREVEFAVAPGLVCVGDRGLMRVLLGNLIGNAWKFTGKSTGARIEVGAERSGGETTFFVRDNGVGFDMANADRLFGAFQRLHGQEEFPGTGIGLATVQRIVHRPGGRVWAEGEVDKGAVFRFTLGAGETAEEG